MHRYSVLMVTVLLFFGCSSVSDNNQFTHTNTQSTPTVTLSHIHAYLLIGNVAKAEQLFQDLSNPQNNAQAMLILAELEAAKGDNLAAQQAFLLAIDNKHDAQKPLIPFALLDYFCKQKMWPAIEGFGHSINSADITGDIKNSQLTAIGQCYFEQDRWQQAKYWFEQLNFSASVEPIAYLALAREAIESEQTIQAQDYIEKYDFLKSTVSAHTLWTAFEVYTALDLSERALQIGEQLRILFPNDADTRKYIVLEKRNLLPVATDELDYINKEVPINPQVNVHIIKKGETLYQLSKRYGVTTPELMSWNPDLVINDISIGTEIRITPIR